MKIAVITSGILPVPAVQGGAVENLIDFYLEYNDIHKLHDITVYSVYHPDVKAHPARHSKVNHYEYVDINNCWFKLGMRLYGLTHHNDCYYHNLEYFFKKVYIKMRDQHFDLIILENRPGFAIKLKQRLPDIPIVSHIHTNMLYEYSEQTKKIFDSTDLFITVSNFLKEKMETIGIPAKIVTVYNGLDSSLFNKDVKPIPRKELGFKEEDFVAVFTGRLVPDKGIKELLLAFQKLQDQKDIKLLVIGAENFADSSNKSPFLTELKQLSATLKEHVVFTGFIPYRKLPQYLATADVMVVPSHINEAFGMTCIEACAMGLPVIATDDGGIPETLAGQKHIILHKNGDLPSLIKDAIIKIKSQSSSYHGNMLNPAFTKEAYSKSLFKNINSFA
jgi:glycosyltransferase involved in cell wall biosynthesis